MYTVQCTHEHIFYFILKRVVKKIRLYIIYIYSHVRQIQFELNFVTLSKIQYLYYLT